jgi:hypothetical protein
MVHALVDQEFYNKPFIGTKMTFGEPLTSASFAGFFSKPLSSSLRPI